MGRDEVHNVPHCPACDSTELTSICVQCGTLTTALPDLLEQQQIENETLVRKLQAAWRDVRKLRGEELTRLKQSKNFATAIRVLECWRDELHPGAREIRSGERLKNVMARLNAGYTEEELVTCILGYGRFPFIVNGRRSAMGSPADRRIDAELIFRDPKRVDQGLALALEAERRDRVIPQMPQPETLPGVVVPVLSVLGQAALRLAEYGWLIFPVAPRGKTPMTANGFKDATRESVRITAWWLRHPDHNIGIRCGIESKLVVLDVDGQEGYSSLRALEAKSGALPSTASVVTPRGGSHYYFQHPGTGEVHNTFSFPGPGLDIRGDGGYVLGPPSVGANGKAYEVDEQAAPAEIPGWLLKLLVERQSELPGLDRDYESLLQDGVREGARDKQMTSLVGYLMLRHSPEHTRDIAQGLNEARCKPPLTPKQVEKIVDSVRRRELRRSQSTLKAIVKVL